MCFGRKSKSQPAPVTPQPNPANVADTSNDAAMQRQQMVAATTPQPSTFGAELGNPQQGMM